MIILTGLTLLVVGAEEDFIVGAEGDVGEGFAAVMGGDVGEDFVADIMGDLVMGPLIAGFVADSEEEAGAEFGVDAGEDVSSDFDSDSEGDSSVDGGSGVKIDARGNRTLHASRTGGEDKSLCSLSSPLTRRGLDAPSVGAEDES
jgi:hypothetical protein